MKQAGESQRVLVLLTDKLWGWQDPSLTKRERMAANHGGLEVVTSDYNKKFHF
jgi:hypothetical protein